MCDREVTSFVAGSNSMSKLAAFLVRRRSPVDLYLKLNGWLWRRLPPKLRDARPMRFYGTHLYRLVSRRANRRQFTGTFFFRNRPALELMRRLAAQKSKGSTLSIAVLGCSIGAEVYSILSTLRRARPDLVIRMCAVDNSSEVLKVAKEAVYSSQTCALVGASIFERMTEAEFKDVFEGTRREATVRSWIREGISWHLGDAGDPDLVRVLGPQDIVVASNFLCHMEPLDSETCLRSIVGLVKPGGYLFVTGVDLDVREKVARDQQWQPVPELVEEIHEGDPSVRRDWPCAWWGLEPFDTKRVDWQMRYAAVFRLTDGA
jgi:chemotaxis methyl-accepting protein methylase